MNRIMEARIVQLEEELRRLTIGVKTKDLSLAASIKEWSGHSKAKPVTEFLTQLEQCAQVSNWSKEDLVNILKAKLTGEALQFVNGKDELTDGRVSYEVLKAALVDRFTEKLPARFHYNLLHEATQGKDETPIQFLDRCRALSQKTIRQSADPTEQRIRKEEADFRLLTSFIYGMRGEAGRELRIRNPETVEQALSIATMVHNAKRLEQRPRDHETLVVKTERKDATKPNQYKQPWRQNGQPRGPPTRRPQEPRERSKDQVRPPITCFSCGQQGHIARRCEAKKRPTTETGNHSPN